MSWNVVDRYHLDPTGALDNAEELEAMRVEISELWAARKPLPRLVFPEGIYTFSRFPSMAFHNLELVAEGQAILKYTGTDDAVTFQGEDGTDLPGIGKRNVVFDGFTIDPGTQARHGLMLSSIHASTIRVKVLGAGSPRDGVRNSAIYMQYCVLTQLMPTVSNLDLAILNRGGSLDCIGVTLDIIGNIGDLPASAVRIVNPILENLDTGIYSKSSFFCGVRDGSIEYCRRGIYMESGGYMYVANVELEGNREVDVYLTEHAHDNIFWCCGNGHPRDLKVVDESLTTGNQVVPIGPPPFTLSWGR